MTRHPNRPLNFVEVPADADYAMLENVRETWGPTNLKVFAAALAALWARGSDMSALGLDTLNYRPGDYCYAALAVLKPHPSRTP
jgi:hypothetical protein